MSKTPAPKKGAGGRPKSAPGSESIVITLTLSPQFLAKIDAAANTIGDNRTSFIRHAIAAYLQQRWDVGPINFPSTGGPSTPDNV